MLVILGGYATILWKAQSPMSEEEIRKNYIVEYTKSEQSRLDLDCNGLQNRLKVFLPQTVLPLIHERNTTKFGGALVPADVKRELNRFNDQIYNCGRLFVVGQNGELNGLQGLKYASDIEPIFVRMTTLLQYFQMTKSCDAKCVEARIADIQQAYDGVSKVLAQLP